MQINKPSIGFNTLPDYILRGYIVPYLGSTTLFNQFRTISTYCFNSSKDSLEEIFPEELMAQLKNICKLNEHETLTKHFNERCTQLLQNKNMLFIYTMQINFADVVKAILEETTEIRVVNLCRLFLLVLNLQDKLDLLDADNFYELRNVLNTETCKREFKERLDIILDVEVIDYNIEDYVRIFAGYDENYLKNINELITFFYNFVGKLIEFQVQKVNHNQLKQKLDKFLELLTNTSNQWPMKKLFFEKTVELSKAGKTTNSKINKMINLFKRFEMDTPLNDYYKELNSVDSKFYSYDNILKNRKLLTDKLTRIEQMALFFDKCKVDDKEEMFKIGDVQYSLIDFLMTLSNIKPSWEINEDNFNKTYKLIGEYISNYSKEDELSVNNSEMS